MAASSAAQCGGLSDDSLLRGRPRVFSSSDSFGLRFNWVKERYRLNLRCDSPILAAVTVVCLAGEDIISCHTPFRFHLLELGLAVKLNFCSPLLFGE